MKKILSFIKKEATLFLGIIVTIILFVIPSSYQTSNAYNGTIQSKALVLEVDNSNIKVVGIISSGTQKCKIKILNGEFKDKEVEGINLLNGSLENDKIFDVGDYVLVTISSTNNEISSVSMVDHYRINYEIILAAILVLLIVVFAGRIGVRSVLSFIITVLALWKIVIPLYLNGYNPIFWGLITILFVTVVIEVFVFGLNKKALASISGVTLGIIATLGLGALFTSLFKINGAILDHSETLLYSGYLNLDLTKIYISTIFIGSSGALMDIATDITQAMVEVINQNPNISLKEAILSGFRVGKSAMGTMTTTLLLAYSGGCMCLLMSFMAQGIPLVCIFNYRSVAGEILDTLVGSFGLIAVAPFTAITSAFFLVKKGKKVNN